MTLLALDGLTVEIQTPEGPAVLLDGIDLALGAGDWHGIVGESGCGKSMTALAIMGLLPDRALTRGRVRLRGS